MKIEHCDFCAEIYDDKKERRFYASVDIERSIGGGGFYVSLIARDMHDKDEPVYLCRKCEVEALKLVLKKAEEDLCKSQSKPS